MKIKIGDNNFKIKLVSRKQYNELTNETDETEATTYPTNHTIIFADDAHDFANTVRHELFHAYFSLNLVNSSNLDMDQTEELSAEIIGKYGEDIVKASKKVTSWIRKKLSKK